MLRGEPLEGAEFFASVSPAPPAGEGPRLVLSVAEGVGAFARNLNAATAPLIDTHCARLSGKTGGTIAKLYATGADPDGRNSLPAQNARQMGYALADLGGPQVLKATRRGQTGCHWYQVDCRHYHWVPVDYAPAGRDMLLDDFEPTCATFAMLGLEPAEDTLQARLDLRDEVDRRLILPIEQMGCDVMNVGLGLAALFEGVERGIIPPEDLPPCLSEASPKWGGLRGTSGGHGAGRGDAALRPGVRVTRPARRGRWPPGPGRSIPGNAGHRLHQWEGDAGQRRTLQRVPKSNCAASLPSSKPLITTRPSA